MSDRPTAAIDRAWKQNDELGVEKALKEYATEDEQVICLTIENTRSRSVEFGLEPWGEYVPLSPGSKVRVFICEPKQLEQGHGLQNRTHIQFKEEFILLWAPSGAMAYVLPVNENTDKLPNTEEQI